MKSKTINTKELFYYEDLLDILGSKNYAFTKKHTAYLNKPRFTIKKSQAFVESITYRKINDWDSKNMISGSRNNVKAGWRKFSLVDIIRFYIIKDLRKYGLNIEKIKKILGNVSSSILDLEKNGKTYKETFLQLEYYIFSCLDGEKILLLIDEKCNIFFFKEKNAVLAHFFFDKAYSPLIILPFFSYIEIMLKKKKEIKLDSTIAELYENMITKKEKKILDIINKKNYESITIKKQNGEINTIKAIEILKGDFSKKEIFDTIEQKDYQTISILVANGKKLIIKREETFK